MAERFADAIESDFPLEVWSMGLVRSSRSWSLDPGLLKRIHPRIFGRGPKGLLRFSAALARTRPTVCLALHGQPVAHVVLLAQFLGLTKAAIYVEQTRVGQSKESRLREAGKRLVLNGASQVLVPGPETSAYVRRYRSEGRDVHSLQHPIRSGAAGGVGASSAMSLAIDGETIRAIRLLFVGRVEPEKGIWDLIAACDRLSVTHNILLRVVGDGRDHLTLQTESTGRRWLEVRPFAQPEELVLHYQWADIFVLPSHWDTYGLVVDEALGQGVPVVASSEVGEIKSRLSGGAGVIFVAGNVDDLERALRRYIEDEALRAVASASARQFATSRSPERWVSQVADVESRAIQ